MVWTVNTYKGQKTWYEAELIENLKQLCRNEIGLDNWGKYFAQKILRVIKEYEKERK